MAVWIQGAFLLAGLAVGLSIGDGRLADPAHGAAMAFATRAWAWPETGDLWIFAAIGILIGSVSWTLSQAYRIAPAATVAPFEYTALPMAVLCGLWPAISALRLNAVQAISGRS